MARRLKLVAIPGQASHGIDHVRGENSCKHTHGDGNKQPGIDGVLATAQKIGLVDRQARNYFYKFRLVNPRSTPSDRVERHQKVNLAVSLISDAKDRIAAEAMADENNKIAVVIIVIQDVCQAIDESIWEGRIR